MERSSGQYSMIDRTFTLENSAIVKVCSVFPKNCSSGRIPFENDTWHTSPAPILKSCILHKPTKASKSASVIPSWVTNRSLSSWEQSETAVCRLPLLYGNSIKESFVQCRSINWYLGISGSLFSKALWCIFAKTWALEQQSNNFKNFRFSKAFWIPTAVILV